MIDKKPSRKELFDAANILAANCNAHPGCVGCDFFKNSWRGCALRQTPTDWQHFAESLWSDADIQMAKALKAYGYTHIRRNSEKDGDRIFGLIVKNGIILRIAEILRDGFANAEPYKVYSLDDIIAEVLPAGSGAILTNK